MVAKFRERPFIEAGWSTTGKTRRFAAAN